MTVVIYGVYESGRRLSFAGRLRTARDRHEAISEHAEILLGGRDSLRIGDLRTVNGGWEDRPKYYEMEALS